MRSVHTGSSSTVVPMKSYANADLNKLLIIQENTGKSGIYRWVNLVNKKSYVGSSVNLGTRFKDYYSFSYLAKQLERGKSIIYNVLLLEGYSAFSLEIIEYCERYEAISREQYYIDLLKPEYNILKIAGD